MRRNTKLGGKRYTMRKLLSVFIILAMALTLAVPALADDGEPGDVFADISGHWAREEILSAHGSNIVKGYPDGTFRPDALVTRGSCHNHQRIL